MMTPRRPGWAIWLVAACAAWMGIDSARAQSSGPRDRNVRNTRYTQDPAPAPTPAPPLPSLPPSTAPDAPATPIVPGDPISAPEGAPVQPGEPGASTVAPPGDVPGTADGAAAIGETNAAAADPAGTEAPETTLLMRFLGMEDSKYKIYGWIQNSFTGNANGLPRNGQNFGVNPNYKANQWMGNQYYLIFEKPLEQNDEVNFGFRVDNLFGNDWTFNHARGLLDTQTRAGLFYGYDLAQAYAQVHLPVLTEGGVDIKGGRFYTIAGYEQVPAISRPLLSVPYMFNYGQPFTHFGMLSTWHVTKKFDLFNGVINGWDRWIDQRYKFGYIGGFTWTFNEDKTNLSFAFIEGPNQFPSFIPGGQNIQPTGTPVTPNQFAGRRNNGYGDDNRFLFTSVLTHKWSDKLTQVLETDQAFEYNIAFLERRNAIANQNTTRRKDAAWYSFGNWFLYSFNDKLTGVWRSEVFWDPTGVRTGTDGGRFYEQTLGLIYKPKSWLWFRPEARYDWSQFVKPYSDGTRSSQLTLAFDVIFLF